MPMRGGASLVGGGLLKFLAGCAPLVCLSVCLEVGCEENNLTLRSIVITSGYARPLLSRPR